MDKEKDILIKKIHDRLIDYEFPVEDFDSVWASVEKDLIKSQKTFRWPVKRIVMLSAAATVAILLCLNLFLTNKNANNDSNSIFLTNNSENQDTIEEKTVQITNPFYEQNNSTKKKNIQANVGKEIAESNRELQIIQEDNPEEPEEVDIKSSTPQEEPKFQKKGEDFMPNLFVFDSEFKTYGKRRKGNKNFSFSLSIGNSGTLSINGEPTTPIGTPPNVNGNPSDDDMGSPPNEKPNGNDNSKNATEIIDIKYNIPVSAGFSVRKHFADSWALESGLVYTYLSSTETHKENRLVTIDSKPLFYDKKTELHYLGIPLKLVCSFYNSDRISLYATAGGMGGLCVYGKEKKENESARLNVPEIQWSAFAGAGINYKLINRLNLFIEPEIVYYFDDGSELKTIRKSVPFNVNLQVGLRLTY